MGENNILVNVHIKIPLPALAPAFKILAILYFSLRASRNGISLILNLTSWRLCLQPVSAKEGKKYKITQICSIWIESSLLWSPIPFIISCNAFNNLLRKVFLSCWSSAQLGLTGEGRGQWDHTTVPTALVLSCQHLFWLVIARAALMFTCLNSTPDFPHFTGKNSDRWRTLSQAAQLNLGPLTRRTCELSLQAAPLVAG